jgi:5-hydroxyisourate hydrolase-like protein (transthyretin family)
MSRHRTRWFAAGIAVLVAAALGFVALPAHAAGTGTVTGRFTDGATPIADTFVTLYDLDFNQVRETSTDADGAFTLANVRVGSYKLSFTVPGVVTQFAFGKPENFDGADVITVTDGAVTTVEDTLAPHGEIAGRVTDSTGAPVPFINVTATSPDFSYFAFTFGDADGNYRFQFLPGGSYLIQFSPNNGGPSQYANGKRTSEEADHIPVVNGETTTLDQTLIATGTIRGRFTRQGEPIADANVRAFSPETGSSESTFTDAEGAYQLSVWPDTYVLQFERADGELTQYARQKLTEPEADRFTVAAGEELVVDEEAIATGTVTGRLTGTDGNPVAGAFVGVSRYGTDRGGRTDADGRYEVEVFPGEYLVSFGPRNVGRQWAHGKSSAGSADLFTVVAGASTVVDEVLRPTGSLTVRATDAATGAPLANFCVFIPGLTDFDCATDGVLRLPALAGRYEVQAQVEDQDYLANRKTVTVTSGQDTAVTIALSRQGRITTTVTDAATGAPVANVCLNPVRPLVPSGLGINVGYCSDEAGRVTVEQLTADTYNIFAWARDGEHGHQWVGPNGGTGAQAKARLVTVRAGQTVTVPPIRLDRAGTITGVITNRATGDPVRGIVGLSSFDTGFGLTGAQVEVGSDGRYTIAGLGPYAWPLFFASFGLAAQWSGGTPNRFLATGVRVRVGQTTTYNQALRRGSTVSARVVGPGGTPIDFARITVRHALTGDVMGSGDCDATSRCGIEALGPQAVRLHYYVQAHGEQYNGYHRDAADFAHATIVTVPSSGTRNVTVEATRLSP